jgi:hypothetical protein
MRRDGDETYWVIYNVATGKELPIRFHDWHFALIELEGMNRTYGKTQQQEEKSICSKN